MKMCDNSKCHEFKLTQTVGRFCTECGMILVDKPQCECGEEIGKFNKFCRGCGRPMK